MKLHPDCLKLIWTDLADQCDSASDLKTVLLVGAEGRTKKVDDELAICQL